MVKRAMIPTVCVITLLLCLSTALGGDNEDHSIGHRIAEHLREKNVSAVVIVMLISALPIVELRGAIPVAHHMFSMNPFLAYLLAVIGNMIPVIPLLLLLGPASSFFMRFKWGKRFFDWFFERTRRKSASLEKYQTLGLAAFVAIPLPVTGAWTGCAAAFLMGIRFRHAVPAILLGVMVAGLIVTVLSLMGWLGALIAGTALIALLISTIMGLLRREEDKV
jgi:uncharacterized membrane protein